MTYNVVWNATIVHHITSKIDHALALEGHKAYLAAKEEKAVVEWAAFKSYPGDVDLDEDLDALDIYEKESEVDDVNTVSVDNEMLRTLEGIPNIHWDIDEPTMEAPLKKHQRKAELLNPDLFLNTSALTSFLRYIPLAFWKQVY